MGHRSRPIIMTPFSSKPRPDRASAIDRVIEEVTSWPGVTMAPHPFDAVEFRLDGVEFGHLNREGRLDIPFVRRIRNALVDGGSVERDPSIPDSGWITFDVEDEAGARHAISLLKLSWIHRSIESGREDVDLLALRDELSRLELPGHVQSWFEDLMARRLGVRATTDG